MQAMTAPGTPSEGMMPEHTPLPWSTDDYHRYIWGPDMQMVADTPDEVERYVLRMRGVGAQLPIEANAAYIVKSANAYPRLVSALQREVAQCVNCEGKGEYPCCEFKCKIHICQRCAESRALLAELSVKGDGK